MRTRPLIPLPATAAFVLATAAFVLATAAFLLALPFAIDSFAAARTSSDEAQLGKILDGWADALGGRENLAATGAIRMEYRAKLMGMDGTMELWSSPEGKGRVDLDIGGVFRIVQVWDGEEGWGRDQNGKLSRHSGEELRQDVGNAYFSSWSHLLSDRMTGVMEYLGKEEETGLHILRILPTGGDESLFYLDPDSNLPVRSEQQTGDQTTTLRYSNWKTFDGIVFAGRISQRTPHMNQPAVFDLERVSMHQTPPPGTFARPVEEADDASLAAGSSARDIPIELNTVHIFVQVRVNDSRPLWFILDTGASVTVLTTRTARQLGFELKGGFQARGAGEGSQDAYFLKDVSYQVGGAKLEGQNLVAISLGQIENMMGREIDGILGYDFISRFVVEIDYPNLKMHLHERDSYTYEGSGTIIPIRLEHGHPHMEGAITPYGREPLVGDFLIDTGASASLIINAPFSETNSLLASLPDKFLYEGGGGVGGKTRSYIGRLDAFRIGDLVIRAPICAFSQDKGGAMANPDVAGILGGEILSRCNVIFDYQRERMILEPANDFDRPYHFNLSGLRLSTGGRGDWHTFEIRDIVAGSPAEQAGLEIGDIVKRVDGKPAAEYTIHTLYEIFKMETSSLSMVIDRDGKEMTRTLRLQPML